MKRGKHWLGTSPSVMEDLLQQPRERERERERQRQRETETETEREKIS